MHFLNIQHLTKIFFNHIFGLMLCIKVPWHCHKRGLVIENIKNLLQADLFFLTI